MPIITLTTDFGTGSPYVAAMKAVILGTAPDATLVDISHDVPPFDMAQVHHAHVHHAGLEMPGAQPEHKGAPARTGPRGRRCVPPGLRLDLKGPRIRRRSSPLGWATVV